MHTYAAMAIIIPALTAAFNDGINVDSISLLDAHNISSLHKINRLKAAHAAFRKDLRCPFREKWFQLLGKMLPKLV
jgi:hypothetical protein